MVKQKKEAMYNTTTLLSLCQSQEVGSGAQAASLIDILQHEWEGKRESSEIGRKAVCETRAGNVKQ